MITNKNINENENARADKLLTAMFVVLYFGGLIYYCYYMVDSMGQTIRRRKIEKTVNVPRTATSKNVMNYIQNTYSNQL